MKPTILIEQLYNYCSLHPNAKTKDIVEYFVASNYPKRTSNIMWRSGRAMNQRLKSLN